MKAEKRFFYLAAFVLLVALGLFDAARSILIGRAAGGKKQSHKVEPSNGDRSQVNAPPSNSDSDTAPSNAGSADESADPDSDEESDESSESGDEHLVVEPLAAEPGTGDLASKASGFGKFPCPRLTPVAPAALVPRSQIATRIQGFLAAKGLASAKIGISIVAADGTVLFEKDATTPLVLASNNKLFTTAAALVVLGPDFEFNTRLCARGKVAGGVIDGDLVIVGDGDPDLLPDDPKEATSLAGRIAAALKGAGIQRVSGDLIVDDSIFDRQYIAPQWLKTQLPHDYAAPVSGFSLYENCLVARVRPASKIGSKATVTVLPESSALALQADVLTASAKAKNMISIPAPVPVGKVRISGETPFGKNPVPLFVPLADPGATHPTSLKDALARAGVVVIGAAKLAPSSIAKSELHEIASVKTPLRSVLHKVDKESSNVLAEHVYKRVGAAKSGRGTYESASRAVIDTLGKLGIETQGAVSVDGSGLSRGNAYSPRQVALLLRALWMHGNGDLRAHLVDSLPIAGVDGTLSKRMTQGAYKGRVRAKTGYIAGVSALSGYAATDGGDVICFSVLVNGVKGATAAKQLEDSIAKLLVDLQPK